MPGVDDLRVATLEELVDRDQTWSRMAERYGVANPVPPWKSRLDGMCDAFDAEGVTLPLEARRGDEDLLGETVYAEVPAPERQLLALAHSLIARGVIDEDALATRMATIRERLEAR